MKECENISGGQKQYRNYNTEVTGLQDAERGEEWRKFKGNNWSDKTMEIKVGKGWGYNIAEKNVEVLL